MDEITITVTLPRDAADRFNDLAADVRKTARAHRNAKLIESAEQLERCAKDLQEIVDRFPVRRRSA